MELSRRTFIVAGGAAIVVSGLAQGTASASPGRREPQSIWLPGDTHVHDDHSSDGSLPRQTSKQTSPGNLPLGDQIAQAERTGLAFTPLTDHRTYDQHWDPQWTSDKLLLVPGEEANGSPHAIVLGATDTVVDGANPPGSAAFRHVQQSIWDAHAQDAIWSTAHPDSGEYTPLDGPNDNASAQGMNTVEVYNVASNPDAEVDYAENRWNRGLRFGVSSASDCHFREVWDIAGPGLPTTWVFAAERSVRAILDALRAGRTTISNSPTGPFATIEADVDGDGEFEAIGGDEVIVPDRRLHKDASLRVRVRRAVGVTVLVYAAPGRAAGPIATFSPTLADQTYLVPITLGADHTWFRVELRSPGPLPGVDSDPNLPDQLRGATSPVFVSVHEPATPQPEIELPDTATDDDGAQPAIGTAGQFAGFADVADCEGLPQVVAEVHLDHRTSVVHQRINPQGYPIASVELSAGSGTALAPRIAAAGRDVWVVWQDERGQEQPHRPAIYLRHSDNAGRTFGPAVRLSSGTGRAIQPAITSLDAGHPVVAWADNSGGAFDVYVQVVGVDAAAINVSAAGKVIDAGNRATDARSPRYPASLFPSVTAGPDGRVIVAWQDNRFDPDPLWTGHTPPAGQPASGGTDPDNWQILAAVRTSGWSSPIQVSAVTDAADRHPSVAAQPDGTLVAIWESKALRSSGANLGLRSSRSTDGGSTWSPFEPVALEPTAMSQRARLSLDPDGAVRAVWYDTRSSDWRWKVLTARYEAGWTAPQQLTTLGNGTFPSLGGGFVVFTSDRAATRTQRDPTQHAYLLRL